MYLTYVVAINLCFILKFGHGSSTLMFCTAEHMSDGQLGCLCLHLEGDKLFGQSRNVIFFSSHDSGFLLIYWDQIWRHRRRRWKPRATLCDKTIWNCLPSLICQKCLAVAVDDVAAGLSAKKPPLFFLKQLFKKKEGVGTKWFTCNDNDLLFWPQIDVLPVGWWRQHARKLTSYIKNINMLLPPLKLNIGAYILNLITTSAGTLNFNSEASRLRRNTCHKSETLWHLLCL